MWRLKRYLVCCVLLFGACDDGPVRSPTAASPAPAPTAAPQPAPQEPWTSTAYSLTSTLKSVTGAPCVVRDGGWQEYIGVAEQHEFSVERSGTRIRLSDHQDFAMGTTYEGGLTGRDFIARTVQGPSTFRCVDGTEFQDVTVKGEVTGQLSEDERTLTATLRYSWRQTAGNIDVQTLTWTWSATRR